MALRLVSAVMVWSMLFASAEAVAAKCPGTLSPDEPQDVRTLTSYGVACFESGDYARAYVLYRQAYEQSASPLLLAALGRSLHEVGLYSLARRHYQRFLREAGEDESEAVQKIRHRLQQLDSADEASTSELKLGSTPGGADAYIQLDNGAWVPLGKTPLQVEVRPATWTLRLDKEAYIRQERSLTLKPGVSRREQVSLIRVTSEFRRRGRDIKRAGLMTTLASIPMFATAGLFWGLAESDINQTPIGPEDRDRANRRRGVAIGLTSAGTAALASGLILWFRGDALVQPSDSQTDASQNSVRVRPQLTPASAGVQLTW